MRQILGPGHKWDSGIFRSIWGAEVHYGYRALKIFLDDTGIKLHKWGGILEFR